MKKPLFINSLCLLLGIFIGLFYLEGCTNVGYPYSSGLGGNDSYYDPYTPSYPTTYRSDDEYYRRRELERERHREERKRQIERDKWRARENPKPKIEERCPSGYTPSEQKCSVEERRKGCKDMRLPGGLGCVRR